MPIITGRGPSQGPLKEMPWTDGLSAGFETGSQMDRQQDPPCCVHVPSARCQAQLWSPGHLRPVVGLGGCRAGRGSRVSMVPPYLSPQPFDLSVSRLPTKELRYGSENCQSERFHPPSLFCKKKCVRVCLYLYPLGHTHPSPAHSRTGAEGRPSGCMQPA